MAPPAEERCDVTELLVSQCACKKHRNSPDVTALNFGELQVARGMDAMFNGRCAINGRHTIEPGDEIFLIAPIQGGGEPIGWACEKCAAAVTNG